MRHVLFAIFIALWVLYGGMNWHHYTAALMIAGWVKTGGRLTARVW